MKRYSGATTLSIILFATNICCAQEIETQVMNTGGVRFIGKSALKVLDAIVVLENKIVVADYDGVLYGFKTQGTDTSELKEDLSFGGNGQINLHSRVLEMNRFGENNIVVKTSRDVFLISDGKLEKPKTELPMVVDPSTRWGIIADKQIFHYELESESGTYRKSLWFDYANSKTYPEGYKFVRISSATIFGKTIFIGTNYRDMGANHDHGEVACIDADTGKILFSISSSDSENHSYFGTHLDLEATSRGVTILDSNMRALTLVSPEGEILEKIKGMAFWGLFDIGYLWAKDSSSDSEGNLYVIAASKRDGEKVAEGFIYRISGL